MKRGVDLKRGVVVVVEENQEERESLSLYLAWEGTKVALFSNTYSGLMIKRPANRLRTKDRKVEV